MLNYKQICLMHETERIQNNVVISGAGYSESEDTDKERVNEVLEVLNLDRNQVKYQRRIKSANGSRLDKIVVTFKET
ncbi:hypothetical protein BpHYR1_030912, partial [Brachionus plicatilis]